MLANHKCGCLGSNVGFYFIFFNLVQWPKTFMITTIIPIPKKIDPQTWEDDKSIAISNVFSRILSKFIYQYMVDDLRQIIADVLDQVPGR